MRSFFWVFLFVTFASVLSIPHHHHGEEHDPSHHHVHHAGSSSEESKESSEEVCSGTHEKVGCIMKEKICGAANEHTKCVKKCICMLGFARKGAECVPEDQCVHHPQHVVKRGVPAKSDCEDPNEVYLYCGSPCPARCGDAPGSRSCHPDCTKGCFCKKGYVLNTRNKCVKPEKC